MIKRNFRSIQRCWNSSAMPGNFLKLLSKHLPGAEFSVYLSKAFKFTWGRGFLKFIRNLKPFVRVIKIENFPLGNGNNWCLEHKMTCYILSHRVFLDTSVCTWPGWWVQTIHHLVPQKMFLLSASLRLYNCGWSYACLSLALLLERCPVIQLKLLYCPILGILLDIFQKWSI